MHLRRLLVAAAAVLALTWAGQAGAATFAINSTADAVDAAAGNGTCATAGGACTLRAAVQEANALAGPDTITVPAGNYTLTIAGYGENAAATGDLDVTGAITITGAGALSVTVDANRLDRVFDVQGGSLTLSGVTLTGGGVPIPTASDADPDFIGGAVRNSGTLTILDSTISGNGVAAATATLRSISGGGGVGNGFGRTLTIQNSIVSNNFSDAGGGGISSAGSATVVGATIQNNRSASGGGISNTGTFVLRGSTVSGNTARGTGGFDGNGGGIAGAFGSMVVETSTISANTATNTAGGNSSGAGISYSNTGAPNLTIDRSTISGNGATAVGGGGSLGGGLAYSTDGLLTITNSTIDGNQADAGGGISFNANLGRGAISNSTITGNATASPFGIGGGMYVTSQVGKVALTIASSTLADNAPTNIYTLVRVRVGGSILQTTGGGNVNCAATFTQAAVVSAGYNLVNDSSCAFASTGDATGSAAFGALAANGGPTQTRLPGGGSPALDAIPAGGPCPPSDQRGLLRPTAGGCDKGAVENVTGNVRVFVSAPAALRRAGDSFSVRVAVTNDTAGGLATSLTLNAPASLTAVAGETAARNLGTIAAGATAADSWTYASAPSCADATPVLDLSGSAFSVRQLAILIPGTCGSISGKVTAADGPVANAQVELCRGAVCVVRTTNASGDYSSGGIEDGSYTIRVFPPGTLSSATAGPVVLAAAANVTQNISVTPLQPPPANVTIPGVPTTSAGVPALPRNLPTQIRFVLACPPVSLNWTIVRLGVTLASGTFVPSGVPNTYVTTVPAGIASAGTATFQHGMTCAGDPLNAFTIDYIDPSGTIRDAGGNPVAGATVTLLRSDSAGGPFAAVPNGSTIMSPENRVNPFTTGADGRYAWDVIAGFYKVRAEKGGCAVESTVLTIPPPVTGLDLVLTCAPAPATGGGAPAPAGGGAPADGGGGGGGAAGPAAAPAAPPAAETPRSGGTEEPAPLGPQAAPAPSPVAEPPRAVPNEAPALSRRGAVHVRQSGGRLVVRAAVALGEAATLRVRLVRRDGRAVLLLRGSVVASTQLGRPRSELVARGGPGAVAISLSVARAARSGLRVELVATDAEGAATTLTIPVSARSSR